MKNALALLAPITLAACATTTDAPIVDGGLPQPDGTLVGIDQPAWVGAVVATPKQIVEDSRCPANVQCVWAGRVIVETRIDGVGWRETVPLTLGEPHSTHGRIVTLENVEPAAIAGQAIDPAAYRFRFTQSKNQ